MHNDMATMHTCADGKVLHGITPHGLFVPGKYGSSLVSETTGL